MWQILRYLLACLVWLFSRQTTKTAKVLSAV
jgi:hypothetical protein